MASIKFQSSQDYNPTVTISCTAQTNKGSDRKSVSAGNLSQENDPILDRKALARKQAMRVVTNAFGKEQNADSTVAMLKDDMLRRQENNRDLTGKKEDAEANLKLLREQFGVSEDSAEHRELFELAKAATDGPSVGESASAELRRQQEAMTRAKTHESAYIRKGIGDAIGVYDSALSIMKNEFVIEQERVALSDYERERLGSTAMRDALDAAEDIEDAVSKDIIAEAIGEAKETLDAERDKVQEKAEEIAEERREREEAREEDDALEIDVLQSEEVLQMQKAQTDVSSQVDAIISKFSPIADDIKGIEVDDLL